jgi:hypothetical protein
MNKIDVFKYTDAKLYLRHCWKSTMPPWPLSYGYLAELIGVNKGFLWSTIHGNKFFSRKIAERLPGILKLGKKETFYLRLLLSLSDAFFDNKTRTIIVNKFRPAKYIKQ